MKPYENYNSPIYESLFCWYMKLVRSCMFQHLLFQFTIYDFDSFWFMGSGSGRMFVFRLSSAALETGKRGLTRVLSLSRPQQHTPIVKYLFLFRSRAITFSPMSSRIAPSHLAHALSRFPCRSSLRSLYKKQWNIFTHEKREKKRQKESWLTQKWNRRKKRAIIMCNFETQNIIQP